MSNRIHEALKDEWLNGYLWGMAIMFAASILAIICPFL